MVNDKPKPPRRRPDPTGGDHRQALRRAVAHSLDRDEKVVKNLAEDIHDLIKISGVTTRTGLLALLIALQSGCDAVKGDSARLREVMAELLAAD